MSFKAMIAITTFCSLLLAGTANSATVEWLHIPYEEDATPKKVADLFSYSESGSNSNPKIDHYQVTLEYGWLASKQPFLRWIVDSRKNW
jgi:hypothetical protein